MKPTYCVLVILSAIFLSVSVVAGDSTTVSALRAKAWQSNDLLGVVQATDFPERYKCALYEFTLHIFTLFSFAFPTMVMKFVGTYLPIDQVLQSVRTILILLV